MEKHVFILEPGKWLGEGIIEMDSIDENLSYFTRWNVSEKDGEGKIFCTQEVQIKGLSDIMYNEFVFSEFTPTSFVVELDNETLGKVKGKGIISEETFGWEFKNPGGDLEGFELYERMGNNDYSMRAEYATDDDYRTQIKGKIWHKEAS